MTGAHGYETLCTRGYNISRNNEHVLIENCEKLAEGELPITCPICHVVEVRLENGNYPTLSMLFVHDSIY